LTGLPLLASTKGEEKTSWKIKVCLQYLYQKRLEWNILNNNVNKNECDKNWEILKTIYSLQQKSWDREKLI
jgi:hypothetical protein